MRSRVKNMQIEMGNLFTLEIPSMPAGCLIQRVILKISLWFRENLGALLVILLRRQLIHPILLQQSIQLLLFGGGK